MPCLKVSSKLRDFPDSSDNVAVGAMSPAFGFSDAFMLGHNKLKGAAKKAALRIFRNFVILIIYFLGGDIL